ncbi:MAG: pseudaminic acid synthase [Paraburkholderia sp.]|uniref:pseudaminic acid synthase n=1 Tax=Paraburkholderia sp. TaxID=1926495 RepID=UPI00121489A3|nr:pseudaminic acid synthase [Paraburkholderia sp.]TAM06663.1 MAG: pseudaminic acid synthase [Paraburkholderia sp.]TAM28487.1 MAG: pseudaminic acid synthase [Paraburkholderia sp.]
MNSTIRIADCLIGVEHPPFIIAEMSGNHNQSLERAFELVDAAARAGAHAIKLQTYTADTITLNVRRGEFNISDEKSLWNGSNLYDLYSKAYTPWEWHAPIMERAKSHGLICFSSPFDETAVDFLDQLGVPAFKIASFENNHLPLIRKAARTGKPIIMSTGMATLGELDEAVQTAREAGCKELVLLKCTSTYPASPENTNIRTIPHMRELLGCQVGLSDHTMGVGVSVAAVALGATVIEKHFTLRRADGGVDSAFSLEPAELESLISETHRAWLALGQVTYGPTPAEMKSIEHRRSLYVAKDMKAGDVFTTENLRVVRPGAGLAPRHYESLLGKKIRVDAQIGTALRWAMVD